MSESLHKEYAKLRRRPFLMPLGFPVAGALLLLVIAGWLVVSASTTTIFVMRHAETAAEGPDPGLSPAGELRAERLAQVFASPGGDFALDGVVVSSRRRTQDTARPLANALGIPVVVVESDEAAAMARRALEEFHGRHVLVIGHSNTVPGIVRELSGRDVPPMSETDYGTVYVVARPQFSRESVTVLRLP
ncbi:MAG: hypothetical protein AMJ67_17555 [Betaproteobacteria bacterium SG8_41]|nr:MAG: hypothetical protein AMJ67_17555 [Betaproteobacteria bacterium SG8_41]